MARNRNEVRGDNNGMMSGGNMGGSGGGRIVQEDVGDGTMSKIRNFFNTKVPLGDNGLSIWVVFIVVIGIASAGGIGNIVGNLFGSTGLKFLIWGAAGAYTLKLAADGLENGLYRLVTLVVLGYIVLQLFSVYIPRGIRTTNIEEWNLLKQDFDGTGGGSSDYSDTYESGGGVPNVGGGGNGGVVYQSPVDENYQAIKRAERDLKRALDVGDRNAGRDAIATLFRLDPNSEIAWRAEADIDGAEALGKARVDNLPVGFTQYTLNHTEVAISVELLQHGRYKVLDGCTGVLRDWSEVAIIRDITVGSWLNGTEYAIKCNVLAEIGTKKIGNSFSVN